jgi:hypothetical protein
VVLVVDYLGVAAMTLDLPEVGGAHVLADLLKGVPMAVVGFQILKEFGPNARIPAHCRIQDPSLHQIRKDTDLPAAFSSGHLVDTDASHIRDASLLARQNRVSMTPRTSAAFLTAISRMSIEQRPRTPC